jgi:zinc/manganese transport system substrate-binding protein
MSVLRILTVTLTLLALSGLAPAQALAKIRVVATLPDLAAVAKEVGGNDIDLDVDVLALPTQDPHFVDARPHLVIKLNRADLLLLAGLQLEAGWLPTLLTGARNGRIQPGSKGYFDASTVVPLQQVPTGHIDRSMGDIHPGGNPHYMADPRNGARVAAAIAQRFSQLDPAHAAGYQARAKDLQRRALTLAAVQSKRFASLPANRRQVVTYHQSLVYLVNWLGLKQVNTIEPKPGIPPAPQHIAALLGQMRKTGVEVIAQEEYFPTAAGRLLADKARARLVVLPGGTNVAGGQTYLQYVQSLADKLWAGVNP